MDIPHAFPSVIRSSRTQADEAVEAIVGKMVPSELGDAFIDQVTSHRISSGEG